jgi:hypothetical protein
MLDDRSLFLYRKSKARVKIQSSENDVSEFALEKKLLEADSGRHVS